MLISPRSTTQIDSSMCASSQASTFFIVSISLITKLKTPDVGILLKQVQRICFNRTDFRMGMLRKKLTPIWSPKNKKAISTPESIEIACFAISLLAYSGIEFVSDILTCVFTDHVINRSN